MIIITKDKNYCFVTGDKGTLQYARKVLKELLTIINEEYHFVEKRFYSTLNYIKKLEYQLNEYNEDIERLKNNRKNNYITLEKYNYEVSLLRQQTSTLNSEISKKKFNLSNIEKYLKFNSTEICFYKENKETNIDNFEIGFLRKVIKQLKTKNISFRLKKLFPLPKLQPSKKDFDFNNKFYAVKQQYYAILEILQKGIGIIKMPTGSGKSEIARQFINVILPYSKKENKRILFIVEQSDLLLKTKEEDFTDQKTGKYKFHTKTNIGLVGAGFYDYKNDIVICTIQTLNSLLKREPKEFKRWAKTFCAYIVDECDMFVTDKRLKLLRKFENTLWRMFLSATPFSRFKEVSMFRLIGISGGIIYTAKEEDLKNEGFLSKQESVFLNNYCLENGKHITGKNKWVNLYKQLIVDGKNRNKIIFDTYEVLKKYNIRSLFITENVEHGKYLQSKFEVPFYSGSNDIFERKQAIKKIQNGDEPIIITTRIFRRAINIPELQVYVNCAGMKNDNIVIQAKGRIGRIKKQNESKSLYIDIFDYGNDILEKHSQEREKTLLELKIPINKMYSKDLEKYIKNYFNK